MPAVKNNKVTTLGSTTSYFNDPVSLNKHLNLVVEAFSNIKK